MPCAFPCFPVFVMVMRFGLQYAPYLHDCELTHFIEIWNPKLEGGARVDLQLKPKCVPPVFFFLFFFYWQCGRGNLLSSSHKNDLHKNAQEWATKERVPSQHGLMTLCLFAYIYLYNYAEVPYLQLNLAVRRMLHKASSKEKKERDPLWHLWPHQNEQPLVYPVNVTHFKDLC